MKHKLKNYLLLLGTIVTLTLIDRILLLHLGLPLWEWDEKLHYKHRASVTYRWSSGKAIHINEYGFHDNPFPIKKKKGELRILNLGDSITMGHEVTRDETFSKFLEFFLFKSYSDVQAINTGVQGYSTFQEYEVLKRSLHFDPDIVTIGFCLNDVTEPFVVNKDFGGTGLDYHKVTQAPNRFLSYLLNETGFGRLIQEIRIKSLDARQEKLAELYNVRKMLENKSADKIKSQWEFVLGQLSKIYQLCHENNMRAVLLIFPYTFQLGNDNYGWPQKMLTEHAINHNVEVIDYMPIFGALNTTEKYFLDDNHFTKDGHQIVADTLSKLILEKNHL